MITLPSGERVVMFRKESGTDTGLIINSDAAIEFAMNDVVRGEDDNVYIYNALVFSGVCASTFIPVDYIRSQYNDTVIEDFDEYVSQQQKLYVYMNWLDIAADNIVQLFTLGFKSLEQPLFPKNRYYLDPGFYGFGHYMEFPEMVISVELFDQMLEEVESNEGHKLDSLEDIFYTRFLTNQKLEPETEGE